MSKNLIVFWLLRWIGAGVPKSSMQGHPHNLLWSAYLINVHMHGHDTGPVGKLHDARLIGAARLLGSPEYVCYILVEAKRVYGVYCLFPISFQTISPISEFSDQSVPRKQVKNATFIAERAKVAIY